MTERGLQSQLHADNLRAGPALISGWTASTGSLQLIMRSLQLHADNLILFRR